MRLLGIRPEPWEPVDSLSWAKVMAWSLSTNFESELLRARIVEKVGHQRAAQLEMRYPQGHPFIVPSGKSTPPAQLGQAAEAEAAVLANAVREPSLLYQHLKIFLPMC